MGHAGTLPFRASLESCTQMVSKEHLAGPKTGPKRGPRGPGRNPAQGVSSGSCGHILGPHTTQRLSCLPLSPSLQPGGARAAHWGITGGCAKQHRHASQGTRHPRGSPRHPAEPAASRRRKRHIRSPTRLSLTHRKCRADPSGPHLYARYEENVAPLEELLLLLLHPEL